MPVSPTVRVDPDPAPVQSAIEDYTIAVIVNEGFRNCNVRISLYKHVDGLLKGATDLFNGPVHSMLKPGKYFFPVPGSEGRVIV